MIEYLHGLFYPSVVKGIALAGVVVLAWWQGAPELVRNLCPIAVGLIVMDTLTGGLLAIKHNEFDSRRVGRAFLKFITYGLAIITAALIDAAMQAGYVAVVAVLTLVTYQEAISALENLDECGVKLPLVRDYVNRWRETGEGDEERP